MGSGSGASGGGLTVEQLGTELASLLVFWSSWTHRKVEGVALLEGDRARRRVSLDLTVPALPWPALATSPEHTLVPLATITKRDMRQFDATDANGASIPILSTEENGDLSAAFLIALIAAETGHGPTPAQADQIRACVFGISPASELEAKKLVEELGLEQTFSEQWLLRLAREFVLFGVLPWSSAGLRTVIKYSYHWRLGTPRGIKQRLLHAGRRLVAGLGLRPFPFEIELGSTNAASVHLEVQAPAGIRCADLELRDGSDGKLVLDRDGGMVAHAHVSGEAAPTKGVVRFDPDMAGLHRVVTWSAWAVALLLVATRWRLGVVSLDPGTPVSLLLFGPAVLLTWLVRPGENSVVSAVVGPLRTAGLLLAGSLFAVGFGLSVGFDAPPYASGWGHVADAGWSVSIALSVLGGMVLTTGRVLMRSRVTEEDERGG